MSELEIVSEKLNSVSIVENGNKDDYWGFPLHEAFRMAVKFFKGWLRFYCGITCLILEFIC